MGNCIDNRQPSYAGVNINCYTIDPTKLPPDSPLLQAPPVCTVNNNAAYPQSYPAGYYVNNYGIPAQQPAPAQNTKKKRIRMLTDDYIKNLESYLNSPSEDLRKYAANEVIKRLDEDPTRYNDAALNALINKMLQDPSCHNVKATALIALETQLAQGNQNTVKILENMVKTDKSRNGADAVTASNILLKMSAPTKLIDVPDNGKKGKGIIE